MNVALEVGPTPRLEMSACFALLLQHEYARTVGRLDCLAGKGVTGKGHPKTMRPLLCNHRTRSAFDQYARLIDWGRCLDAAGCGYRGILAGAGKRSERHLGQFAAVRAFEINGGVPC